ncbi:MAG: DUF4340 domain-containing protein [Rhizomicrobium sp.]
MMDFRRRNLIVLGALAVISVALAGLMLTFRAQEGRARFTPGEFLPGFAAHVKEATHIHVVSRDGTFDVDYLSAKGSWVLPARGNYPADFERVRQTLIGLAALEAVEPKTARADWLAYIGLDAPPKGSGTAITVTDKADKILAALIIGNAAELENAQGVTGVFVRHPGDNQSYLARAVFTLRGNVADWLETGVMSIEAARLNTVTITPTSGAPFTLARANPSDREYKLQGPPPPKGFAVNPAMLNLIPQLITGFAFVDVQPASQIDFSKAVHLTAHTFDMQNIRMDAIVVKDTVWVRVSAQPDPGTPTMQRQEAGIINARAAEWAYKLSPNKGQLLMTTRDALMTKAEPSGPAGGLEGLPPGMTFGAPN